MQNPFSQSVKKRQKIGEKLAKQKKIEIDFKKNIIFSYLGGSIISVTKWKK